GSRPRSTFNTRLSGKEYAAACARQSEPWSAVQARLMGEAQLAVVPVRHGFPAEWAAEQDVFGPRVTRYPNLCDLVYRYEHATCLARGMAGPLARDETGPYR